MAKARLYGWNGERPAKPVSGQKQIVLFGMSTRKDELHTGHDWAELIGGDLKTKQDPYRVVLYYILRLKTDGCIRTAEREIVAVTRNDEGRHAVNVKTDTAVQVSDPLEDLEQEAQDEELQPVS